MSKMQKTRLKDDHIWAYLRSCPRFYCVFCDLFFVKKTPCTIFSPDFCQQATFAHRRACGSNWANMVQKCTRFRAQHDKTFRALTRRWQVWRGIWGLWQQAMNHNQLFCNLYHFFMVWFGKLLWDCRKKQLRHPGNTTIFWFMAVSTPSTIGKLPR